MRALADEHAIPRSRRLITSVPHDGFIVGLPWVDFGLLLLVAPNQAKRASMPTKLGEFFACGVSPIAHGANSEVVDWVNRARGADWSLGDLSGDALQRAVECVANGVPDAGTLAKARSTAEPHFSLASGAARYDTLFRDVLGA